MLVISKTPAGYAIFKLIDEGKLAKSDSLYEDFETIDQARNVVKLKQFPDEINNMIVQVRILLLLLLLLLNLTPAEQYEDQNLFLNTQLMLDKP
jgi:hypothetical protein